MRASISSAVSQSGSKLLADARTAASNGGFIGTNYDLDVLCFSKFGGWSWAGLGYVGNKGTWLNGSFSLGAVAHEG